ncbi:ATP synthase subunit I [Bariatricus massiliensis]|uniref:ATP synthase subunit I n=1 Tax=Bariatricus massiliensis TaxID=1745713 RepID=A0ABS8DMG9_9FIRM|nr:ATP synthase subunit I [Bariatricus massiliensis]MCB7305771.1 ATP synthase subunit I [Bariatricus massiliensis]MCB7376312.1 ATP synthase subunit I [Bariatricus massiliensis]MCB7388914.1 ATP synthase subunit I [Bariatricus massiliensis]MCB7413087.1 ATP synthase subunit I [Bariatricus massiliensis]MCQ5254968.1 ATP synthase subunit I [Bariatricus massiliensis]
MGKTDNTVLREMIAVMVLYGIILQVVCLLIPGDRIRMAAGLWLGVAAGVGMAVHMKNSLDEALDRGEAGAQKYMQKSYAVRYITVVVVFVAAAGLHIANVLTLFFGVMGLKISAYLQPAMHKLFLKFKKS